MTYIDSWTGDMVWTITVLCPKTHKDQIICHVCISCINPVSFQILSEQYQLKMELHWKFWKLIFTFVWKPIALTVSVKYIFWNLKSGSVFMALSVTQYILYGLRRLLLISQAGHCSVCWIMIWKPLSYKILIMSYDMTELLANV